MFSSKSSRRLSLVLLAASLSAASAAPSVFVAYPNDNYRVAHDHVILEGSVTPGASLKISGQAVPVAADGLFMLWWPLNVGVNNLKLVATQGGQSGSLNLKVTRTVNTVPPSRPTAIVRSSVTPRENIEFWDAPEDSPAERSITVSFVGSPGGRASFHLAGGALQAMREGPAGTYTGTYVLPEQASMRNAAFTVHLTGKDGKTVSAAATGRLTSTLGAIKTGVQKPGTILGLGLNDAQNMTTDLDGNPALFPRNGMTFTLVGRQGTDVRARLAPATSVLISANQLLVSPGRPAYAASGPMTIVGAVAADKPASGLATPFVSKTVSSPPVAVPTPPMDATTTPTTSAAPPPANPVPAVATDPTSIPSTPPDPNAPPAATPAATEIPPTTPPAPAPEPTPVTPSPLPTPTPIPTPPPTPTATGDLQIRIPLGGVKVPFQIEQTAPGQLTLNLYGITAPPTAPSLSDPLVGKITVLPRLGASSVTFDLNTRQLWGFTANYEGNDLLISVRRPPSLNAARPLSGRTITLDPGHGGTQKGGAGSFGIPEKNIVLPIALRVAELLKAQGATVNMTRTTDVTLGLYERDLSAENTRSDLLVSIHANALPDGRDPRGIRGPEVHFSRPQAGAVAGSILNQLRTRLPEIGPGKGLMPEANLALTRPTTQISLLVETAYLTDPDNLRTLSSPDGKERFAQAIAGGIVDFYLAQSK